MSMYCTWCNNLLYINNDNTLSQYKFFCKTCPYIHTINTVKKYRTKLQRKQIDDVLGGADAWKNVDQTDIQCPKCTNSYAYFMQIQTRSADEPMTTFYKCTNFQCQYRWKE